LSDQEDASTAKKSSKKPSRVPVSGPGFNLKRPFDAPVSWTLQNGKPEQCPWLVEMERSQRFSGGFSQLNRELGALEKHLVPTTQEDAVTHQIMTNVINHLTNIEPSNEFHVIGSRCTGFAMSHSDINIMITFPDGQRTDAQRGCFDIANSWIKLCAASNSCLVTDLEESTGCGLSLSIISRPVSGFDSTAAKLYPHVLNTSKTFTQNILPFALYTWQYACSSSPGAFSGA
jgi:hypothetical protein